MKNIIWPLFGKLDFGGRANPYTRYPVGIYLSMYNISSKYHSFCKRDLLPWCDNDIIAIRLYNINHRTAASEHNTRFIYLGKILFENI